MIAGLVRRRFQHLSALRASLKVAGVQAFYLPHADPHQSEYIPNHHDRVRYLTGFTGSSSHLVLTDTQSLLWTDSRYWIQAELELKSPWKLMKSGEKDVKKYQEWLFDTLKSGDSVGFDPNLVSAEEAAKRTSELSEGNISFKPLSPNPIDAFWSERPALPSGKVFHHPVEYSGASSTAKALQICKELVKRKQRFLLSAELTEIAWLLNMRGTDIPYNPVFYGFVLFEAISNSEFRIELYSDRLSEQEKSLIGSDCTLRPYNHIYDRLQQIPEGIMCDKSQVNYRLWQAIRKPIASPSLISTLKAVKNTQELAGFAAAHLRDALAFLYFWTWLRSSLPQTPITELEAAHKLDHFRSKQPLFYSLSFETISASGANGAIVHYRPTGSTPVSAEAMYLVDSGGHYWDGTTDVTRTLHFGTPTHSQRLAYTKVLLGNIDLERTVWPEDANVSGSDLDAIARRRLWESGLDYKHGTGHGVGHFLCVHEGPARISRSGSVPLQAGMVLSNEPGYYKKNEFGVRIENLMAVQKSENMPGFMEFKRLTLIPYDRNLIEKGLLSPADIAHIDLFHSEVRSKLAPLLEPNSPQQQLLTWATAPL
jgi:Xaa-Pro aminopeptidase